MLSSLGRYRGTEVNPLAVVVAPFLPPANGIGDTPPLPYYLCVASFAPFSDEHWTPIWELTMCMENDRYRIVGIGVMFFGVAYWAMWRILLPKFFRYELVSRKETLKDGTVVTLVRPWTKRSHSALIDRS